MPCIIFVSLLLVSIFVHYSMFSLHIFGNFCMSYYIDLSMLQIIEKLTVSRISRNTHKKVYSSFRYILLHSLFLIMQFLVCYFFFFLLFFSLYVIQNFPRIKYYYYYCCTCIEEVEKNNNRIWWSLKWERKNVYREKRTFKINWNLCLDREKIRTHVDSTMSNSIFETVHQFSTKSQTFIHSLALDFSFNQFVHFFPIIQFNVFSSTLLSFIWFVFSIVEKKNKRKKTTR